MDMTGRSLKQYHLIEKLGEGGMGVVYRARDTVLGRDAALKLLPPHLLADDSLRHRFHREARAASALNHPNVVTIYEIGSADGTDFIAMEYVAGRTIQAILRYQRLSVPEAAGYALQAAGAFARAHSAGVIHRDIKPANIMIAGDGLVKILDFGVARLNQPSAGAAEADAPTHTIFTTRAGTVMGTVAYMSPEQANGEEAGPQSDIFSLGVVLFEMLSGELPFSGNTELARLRSLHVDKPRDLRRVSPGLPTRLCDVVARMLEKDLSRRYASMTEVAGDLRPFAGVAGSDRLSAESPTVTLLHTPRPPARLRFGRRLAVPLAAVLFLAAAALLIGRYTRPRAPDPAAAKTFSIDTARPYDIYLRARTLLDRFDREDNPVQAAKLLERAVEKDNQFALGYATLTEAYRFRNKLAPDAQWLKLMSQCAHRALELNPELAASHIAMGFVAMEQPGQAQEAEARFRRALELDPRNPAPHIWMAALFTSARDNTRAVESLQRAIRIDPGNWVPYVDLGLIHYRTADYSEAASTWEQARKLSPDNLRVLPNLAAAYHMLGRYDAAASTLQRAIEIQPAPRHYANLGTLRFFQGRYSDAVAPFEKAVELNPNRYFYWGNLADAYRWAPGLKSKAPAAYLRAVQLVREQLAQTPADPDLRSFLALYLAKSGDRDSAVAELSQFDLTKVPRAAVLFRMSVAYEVSGRRTEALATLEKAIQAGYAEREIRNEPELLNLRSDIRYHKMIAGKWGARETVTPIPR